MRDYDLARSINDHLCQHCDDLEEWFWNTFNIGPCDTPDQTQEAVEALIRSGKVVDDDHDMYRYWMELRKLVLERTPKVAH